jgi:hypothetical protein
LITIAASTFETLKNFQVLKGDSAVVEFRDALNKDLRAKGWPLATDFSQENVIPVGLFDHIMLMPGWFITPGRLRWRGLIQYELDRLSENIKPYFFEDKHLTELEEAVGKATDELKQLYGDPATVKRGTRSMKQAIFNAIAAKFSKQTPETRLCKEMKTVAELGNECKKKGIPLHDAAQRAGDILKTRGWPDQTSEEARPLTAMFGRLCAASVKKTSVHIRYALQDENYPPKKTERAAKDFLIAHAGEFSTALKEAISQLAAEKTVSKPRTP